MINAGFIANMKKEAYNPKGKQLSLYDWYVKYYEDVANTCYVELYLKNEKKHESFNSELNKIFQNILLKSELYREKKHLMLTPNDIASLTNDFYQWAGKYSKAVENENERCKIEEEELQERIEEVKKIHEIAGGDEKLYRKWDSEVKKRSQHLATQEQDEEASPKRSKRKNLFKLGKNKK